MNFKKPFYLLMMTALLSVFIVGCAQEPDSDSNSSGNGADGGELIISVLSDAAQLDPHKGTDIPSAIVYHGKIYEGLVKQNKEMEVLPNLATGWEQLDDNTWEFYLRDDVVFHDGAEFNAEAVKKNFERILDEETASPRKKLFEMIEEIVVVDDYTIQFVTEYPFAPLLSNFAHYAGGIVSPKAIDEHGSDLGQNPAGTGPFVFENWIPGQEIELVKNENYWGDKPKIDSVVFQVIPEDATRISLVETGESHIADPVPVTEIERVENSPNMNLVRSTGLGIDYIGFNTQKAPFNNKLVRQAINYAVDTDIILEGVFNGVGTKAEGPMGPGVWGYSDKVEGYGYDLEKAKQLLKEAGYEDGFKTSIWTNDNQARVDVAEVVASQLKGIGIDVEIKVMEWGAYLESTKKGEHDMFVLGWSNMTGDADYNQYFLFHTDAHGAEGNRTFYDNADVDEYIDLGRKESNVEKRLEYYEKAQLQEVEDAPMIFLRNDEDISAVGKNVDGFWVHPSGIYMINDVTIN
ncbi:glutathione ABC transporter substrate-binding protein [Salirhabdus salicampi]|uniref:glutathione ABC transporter substrate-binding protein n=1 Tax=Salirhabdus salicampi TaxID=476102 RepID=UPI0020C43FF5|nr:glutathione ABC transporter substrate-binding protein [Salirhabdus salicampi]MCP8615890.1 glutathione ABC transporter substrate-binding protein [Salirhabdus salicampi]